MLNPALAKAVEEAKGKIIQAVFSIKIPYKNKQEKREALDDGEWPESINSLRHFAMALGYSDPDVRCLEDGVVIAVIQKGLNP